MALARRALPPIAAALALLALTAATAAGVVDRPQGADAGPALSPDGVIVQWAAGADRGEKAAARAEADVTYTANLGDPGFQLVAVEPGQSPAAAVAALADDPAVAVAERDAYVETHGIPNDPLFGQLWGLRNTGAGVNGFSAAVAGADANVVAAWDRTVGRPETVVADIDSGYRFQHPDLEDVAWTNPDELDNGLDDDGNGYVDDLHGWDFVGENLASPVPDKNPSDDNIVSGGHGVHTAGTIGGDGDNGVGMTGVARDVRIMPLRVCSNIKVAGPPERDELRCSVSALIAAINYAGKKGARVANISLGGNTYRQAEVNAIAANPQTLYVISAGNDGGDNDGGGVAPKGHHYPCDYRPDLESSPPVSGAIDNIVCVAATDQADGLASFSDWGASSVDIGAPGTEILSPFPKQETWLAESFESDDFASSWAPYGAPGFGRAGIGEGPLTSAGMTDTPGAAPGANFIYGVESASGETPPAGTGSCRIHGMRMRKGGKGIYGLFLDGSLTGAQEFGIGETAGSAMTSFKTDPILGLGGHELAMFFEYAADSTPTAAEGLWLDDLRLECYGPLNAGPGYAFLQGTSMATPHVTGAAALLFSLKPEATVTEVRDALLQSAEQIPSLAGKTTTGGRLDVAAALAELVPVGNETVAPDTAVTLTVGADGDKEMWITFERTDADAGEFECKLDEAADWTACTSPAHYTVAPGEHEFQVRAKVPSGLVDPTPATYTWTAQEPPQPPAAPLLESTSPVSPAATWYPRILGSAEAGSTVRIYAGTECAGTPVATGSASALASPGLQVTVVAETTAQFSATATDAELNVSGCSAPISFTNTAMIGKSTVTVTDESPKADPIPAPACKVPRLAGKTLAQAKAALRGAGCALGAVTKPKPRKGPRAPKLVVKSSNPAAGFTTPGKVNLKLGPKPKRK